MSQFFLLFAVDAQPRGPREVFRLRSYESAWLLDAFVGRDASQGRLDPERSILFDVGAKETADRITERIHSEFQPFTWLNQISRRSTQSNLYVTTEHLRDDVLARMVRFVIENRVSLGDEGHWLMNSVRDYASSGSLSVVADRFQPPPDARAFDSGYDPDHSDEVVSFRLPSLSVLAGQAQPLADLKGQKAFTKLFLRDGAGVYVVFEGESALYVGMAQRFSQRLMNANGHHKLRGVLLRHPFAQVALLHYPAESFRGLADAITPSEREDALVKLRELIFRFERSCIGFYRPRYNGVAAELQPAGSTGPGLEGRPAGDGAPPSAPSVVAA